MGFAELGLNEIPVSISHVSFWTPGNHGPAITQVMPLLLSPSSDTLSQQGRVLI